MITHGELFAGISGFGLGFSRPGIVTKWCVEIDKQCQQVLRAHNPDTPILSDIRDCGAHNLEPVDIISFGSPCQNFSVAGDRSGLDGEKSSIISEAFRVVRELKPTFAVWENVPGALSSNSGRDFAAILSAFQECGAVDIAYRVLDARYWGVPQRRRRIFLVADFRERRAGEILFESNRSAWDFAPSTKAGTGIAAYTPTGFGKHSQQLGTLRASGGDVGDGSEMLVVDWPAQTAPTLSPSSGRRNDQDFFSQGGGHYVPTLGHTVTTREGQRQDPTGETLIAFDRQGDGDVRLNISEKHTSALQTSQTPAVQGAWGVRRLTPVECERLMGLPDHWTAIDGMSDTARYRMLGNAVCVPMAEWIGRRIMRALERSS